MQIKNKALIGVDLLLAFVIYRQAVKIRRKNNNPD